ncbi:RNA polymerase sigma factor [Cetobacterium sp.]|uniref:RNA polymerase sigma factor n=1 Tax=Cetobacterium sp. TaxID=2071632 RepID=UPI002FCA5FBC
MSDLALIDRLIKKDETALIELIDKYGDLIYRSSNKVLNNNELSEECLNIVLMKIWEGVQNYDAKDGLFKNWIFTISKYTAIDIIRKEEKHNDNKLQLKENISDKFNVEDIVLLKEIIYELKNNIESLKDMDKEIFIQRYEKGKAVKDIATQIGITPKAISLRIMRIRKKLKKNN